MANTALCRPPGCIIARVVVFKTFPRSVPRIRFRGSQFLEVLFPHTSLPESMSGFIIILPVL